MTGEQEEVHLFFNISRARWLHTGHVEGVDDHVVQVVEVEVPREDTDHPSIGVGPRQDFGVAAPYPVQPHHPGANKPSTVKGHGSLNKLVGGHASSHLPLPPLVTLIPSHSEEGRK